MPALRIALLTVLAACTLAACEPPPAEETQAREWPDMPSARGTLRVALHGGGARGDAVGHRHRWVRGPHYPGVEDNDLRGFLDGRFVYGWNQPGQIHSRVGRRPTSGRFGETELFRTLQRWDGIVLPADARVRSAGLVLGIEDGPEQPLDVMLYAVNPDWEPGGGGTQADNTSPPRPGEVWWVEARHAERAWGLPGVGFASEDHPQADTPVTALSEARWEPEQEELRFEGEGLRAYVEQQVRAREPLRFLLKLSDALEDVAGSLLYLYTANHGDDRNVARRPVLELAWEAPAARTERRRLHLEADRQLRLPRLEIGDATGLAVSFEPEPGSGPVTLQVRGGNGDRASGWAPAEHPLDLSGRGWRWAEVRVLAARDPLELGQPFETVVRDTWVRTAPPDTQEVPFLFTAPSGERFEVPAIYRGEYTWAVSFTPEEIGRWRYRFRQSFLKRPYHSEEGVFDVVLLDRENALRQLRAYAERLGEDGHVQDDQPSPVTEGFWRLERAALRLETPESFASPSGRELFAALSEIREILSGRRVPPKMKTSPMKRDWPPQTPSP